MIKRKKKRSAIKWTCPSRCVWAELVGLGFARLAVTVTTGLVVEIVVRVFGPLPVGTRELLDGVMMGSVGEVPVAVALASITSNVGLVRVIPVPVPVLVQVVVIVMWGGIIAGGEAVPVQTLPMGQQPPPVQHTVL